MITERVSTERLIRTLVIVVLALIAVSAVVTLVSLALYFS